MLSLLGNKTGGWVLRLRSVPLAATARPLRRHSPRAVFGNVESHGRLNPEPDRMPACTVIIIIGCSVGRESVVVLLGSALSCIILVLATSEKCEGMRFSNYPTCALHDCHQG